MNKKCVNAAVAVLLALGINACSSGGSDSVGISVEENSSLQDAKRIVEINTLLNEQLTASQQALSEIQAVLAEAKSAQTKQAAEAALNKTKSALETLNKATKNAAYYSAGSNSVESYLTSASKTSVDAQKNVNSALEVISQIRAVFVQAAEAQNALNTEVTAAAERERLAKEAAREAAEKAAAQQQKMTNLENEVNAQLAQIQTQLDNINALLQQAEQAATSQEAAGYATQARTALNNATSALEQAKKAETQAGETNEKITNVLNSAQVAVQQIQTAANRTNTISADLLIKEENIAKEEAERVMQANSQAVAARDNTLSQLNAAETASARLLDASTQINQATSSKNAQSNLATLQSERDRLNAAIVSARTSAAQAKEVAAVSNTANTASQEADAALQQIEQLAANANAALTNSTNRVNSLVTQEKSSTTAYSYGRTDSIVQDYMDSAKRDALLNEIKTSKALQAGGTSCAAGTATAPKECFAGAKAKDGTIIEGKARGTVLGSYAQAYSGYAVIREEYNTLANKNPGDANAYIAIADSSQLVSDKTLVTDATYNGTASYTTGGTALITTDLLTMNVADNKISGYVYRTTSLRGKDVTRTYMQFKDSNIDVKQGIVGFDGEAVINTAPKQVEGVLPTTESIQNGKEVQGTYQGVFAGPNAKEVVGTFETKAGVERSVRGAFAGSK